MEDVVIINIQHRSVSLRRNNKMLLSIHFAIDQRAAGGSYGLQEEHLRWGNEKRGNKLNSIREDTTHGWD